MHQKTFQLCYRVYFKICSRHVMTAQQIEYLFMESHGPTNEYVDVKQTILLLHAKSKIRVNGVEF